MSTQGNKALHRFLIIIGLFTFFIIYSTIPLHAATTSGIMAPGDAGVTGFSETLKKATAESDLFDLDGPSVRIITLPGTGNFGLVNTVIHFTVKARDVGQVFGITLDNNKQPNIYVAATSAYGLAIQNDSGRLKKGAAGAKFVIGQFGPEASNGSSTSIWKIDGMTGAVSLFANVTTEGVQNSPTSLGALAFDSKTQQIFVSDRAMGLIHRFSMDGTDKGTYDHGIQGRPAANLDPVTFDPKTIANIQKPEFDTQNPATWGYAPPERRVFALAVRDDRLYYSVYGPQVWSIGINADGSFADDARVEVDAPALKPDTEISSIIFDKNGLMYIAERGAPTGDYDFVNVANSGNTRVKRYQPQQPTEQSPYLWNSPGDEYAIGMPGSYQNADGGVALTCGRTLWSTADSLLDTDSTKNHINGLQGNDIDLVKPDNSPPNKSWFVNYYDYNLDARSQGTIGTIAILVDCGIVSSVSGRDLTGPSYSYPLPPAPPSFSCPPGTYFVDGGCFIPPTCPEGSVFINGVCIWTNCNWGYVFINGVCVPPPIFCEWGTVYYNDHCIPIFCPPPLERTRSGYCRCPYGYYYYKNHCEPAPHCNSNEKWIDGRCVPQHTCPDGQILKFGWCVSKPLCPTDQVWRKGHCEPKSCAYGQKYVNGHCQPSCQPYEKLSKDHCVKICATDEKLINGLCISSHPCASNQIWKNNKCVNKPITHCGANQELVRGECVTKSTSTHGCGVTTTKTTSHHCPNGAVYKNGHCTSVYITKPLCGRGQVYKHGHCVYVNVYSPPHVNVYQPVYQPPHINVYGPSCGGGGNTHYSTPQTTQHGGSHRCGF